MEKIKLDAENCFVFGNGKTLIHQGGPVVCFTHNNGKLKMGERSNKKGTYAKLPFPKVLFFFRNVEGLNVLMGELERVKACLVEDGQVLAEEEPPTPTSKAKSKTAGGIK